MNIVSVLLRTQIWVKGVSQFHRNIQPQHFVLPNDREIGHWDCKWGAFFHKHGWLRRNKAICTQFTFCWNPEFDPYPDVTPGMQSFSSLLLVCFRLFSVFFQSYLIKLIFIQAMYNYMSCHCKPLSMCSWTRDTQSPSQSVPLILVMKSGVGCWPWKKIRSKIWGVKSRVQKTGSLLFKKRRGQAATSPFE